MRSIMQFLWMFGTMVMLLAGIEQVKAHALEQALPFAVGWALLSLAIVVKDTNYSSHR